MNGKCSAANGDRSAPPRPAVASSTPALMRGSDRSSPCPAFRIEDPQPQQVPRRLAAEGVPRRGDAGRVEAVGEAGHGGLQDVEVVEDARQVLDAETPDPWCAGIVRSDAQGPASRGGWAGPPRSRVRPRSRPAGRSRPGTSRSRGRRRRRAGRGRSSGADYPHAQVLATPRRRQHHRRSPRRLGAAVRRSWSSASAHCARSVLVRPHGLALCTNGTASRFDDTGRCPV